MADSSFTKLFRKILAWEHYSDDADFKLFVTCILKAQYKQTYYHGTQLTPGQFVMGEREMSEMMGWSRAKLLRHIVRLEASGEIVTYKSPRGTIVTVRNWEAYQSNEWSHGDTTNGTTNKTTRKTTNGTTGDTLTRNIQEYIPRKSRREQMFDERDDAPSY